MARCWGMGRPGTNGPCVAGRLDHASPAHCAEKVEGRDLEAGLARTVGHFLATLRAGPRAIPRSACRRTAKSGSWGVGALIDQ